MGCSRLKTKASFPKSRYGFLFPFRCFFAAVGDFLAYRFLTFATAFQNWDLQFASAESAREVLLIFSATPFFVLLLLLIFMDKDVMFV